jgi:hypothetical protein
MSISVEPVIPVVNPDVAVAVAANAPTRYFKLPDFWSSSPHAWFGVVESQFDLRNITSQRDKFSLVAAVLPEASGRKLSSLLTSPPVDCYTALKQAILHTHQLTEMQKMELLFNMEDLGSKRPMDLLTEMQELVRPGDEKSHLFAMLFLRRLPCHVRALLTEDDHDDLQALALKADRIQAYLARQVGGQLSVNAVPAAEFSDDMSELTVSAVAGGGKYRGQRTKNKKKPFVQQPQQQMQQVQQQQQQQSSSTPVYDAPGDFARASSGLCFYHFTYGSRAKSCRAPCNWQGN